jgi:polar amino acid transport system substrate-binding protein
MCSSLKRQLKRLFRQQSQCIRTGLVAALLTVFSLALQAQAAEPRLTVYAELEEADNFAPGSDTPVPIGPGGDLAELVLAEAGMEAEIRVVPWPRLIRSLESQRNVLAFSMTRTPAREELYHWIGKIQSVEFKLWSLAERADEFPAELEQLRDFRISGIRGDVVENYLLGKGFTNLVYLSENSNTLTMMRRDRVDLMPYVLSGMEDYLARKNEPPGTLVPVADLPEISTGHYIVMGKDSDPELVQQLKDAYEAVLSRGDWQLQQ